MFCEGRPKLTRGEVEMRKCLTSNTNEILLKSESLSLIYTICSRTLIRIPMGQKQGLFQRNACKNGIYLGWEKVSCLERCPRFRGVYRRVPLYMHIRTYVPALCRCGY